MKSITRLYCVLSMACLLSLTACVSPDNIVEVPKQHTGTQLVGNGVELDPHFFSQNLTKPILLITVETTVFALSLP